MLTLELIMFTGIIEDVGHVTGIIDQGGTRRLTVSATKSAKQLKRGDSIAVSGVCLTAVEMAAVASWFSK